MKISKFLFVAPLLLVMAAPVFAQASADDIAALRAEVDQLKQQLSDQAQQIQDLKQGSQSTLDAVQEQAGRIDKLKSTKVDTTSGLGNVKLNGLLQEWAYDGSDVLGKSPNIADTFKMRRIQIGLAGNITPQTYFSVNVDPAKSLSATATTTVTPTTNPKTGVTTYPATTAVSVNQANNILQDAYLGYHLTSTSDVEVGQQKVPMSMDGLSGGNELTVDRAIFNNSELSANQGRVGDIRDLGVMYRLHTQPFEGAVAVMDDAGNDQNTTDNNNAKEVFYHGDLHMIPHTMVGAYGEFGGGIQSQGAASENRQRVGGEIRYDGGPSTIQGEYVQGRDGGTGSAQYSPYPLRTQGGYVLYGYTVNPRVQLVTRGEYWNPNRSLTGASYVHEYDLTLGVNYYLYKGLSKIQLNWVRKDIEGPNATNPAATGPTGASQLGLNRSYFILGVQQAF
jgi:hypothetical protein